MGKRGFQPSDELQKRNAEMQKLYDQGWSLREIGPKYGITYERVRQCIDTSDKLAMSALQKATHAEEEYRKKLRICRVCGVEFYPGLGGPKSCSSECSEVWLKVMYVVDPDRRRTIRLSQARYYLRYSERVKPTQVEWAKRILAGDESSDRVFVLDTTQSLLDVYGLQRAEVQLRPYEPRIRHSKTQCKHGHPFNELNTKYVRGRRACAYCNYVLSATFRGCKPKPYEEWIIGREERILTGKWSRKKVK